MQDNQSRYIGIDLGHKTFKAHVLDANGKEVAAFEGSLTTGRIKKQLLAKLQASDQICIESGTLSFWFKQLLENTVHCQVYILNSNSVRLIYDSLKKTDKEDAAKLAWLLYSFPKENLPLVHTPTENQERLRKLATERRRLVNYLGAEKSRFYNLCIQSGYTSITKKDLRNSGNMENHIDKIAAIHRSSALRIIALVKSFEELLEAIDQESALALQAHEGMKKLYTSMPGIGDVTALALIAYMGDFRRFTRAEQVSLYCGLVPRVDNSGKSIRHGHLVQKCNKHLRALLIQAAWALVRSRNGGPLQAYFQRASLTLGRKRAIVATARKMIETLFAMSKSGEFYRLAA